MNLEQGGTLAGSNNIQYFTIQVYQYIAVCFVYLFCHATVTILFFATVFSKQRMKQS